MSSTQTPAKASLFHPAVDALLMGGISLAFTAGASLLRLDLRWLTANLGTLLFVFSYPHFMASYVVFYGGGGPWKKNLGVAVVFPILLAAALVAGVLASDMQTLNAIAHIALVLVFWHFLKQAFGTALWLGAVPGRPLNRAKKELMLSALLLLGCYGYLAVQADEGVIRVFGAELHPFKVAAWTVRGARIAAYGSLALLVAWLAGERVLRKRNDFAWQGWIPLFALATWLEPSMGGSPTRLILPVFHAIQYLPFPLRARLQYEEGHEGQRAWGVWVTRALVWGGVFFTGIFFFRYVPFWAAKTLHGSAGIRAIVFVQLFFNLHHYFIDGVIWRFSDPEVRRRLMVSTG